MTAYVPADSSAFVRWQLPAEYDAPVGKARQRQFREDFRRNVGLDAAVLEANDLETKKVQKKQPQKNRSGPTKSTAGNDKKSALKVALAQQQLPELKPKASVSGTDQSSASDIHSRLLAQSQLLQAEASPAEQSVIQRALMLTVERTVPRGQRDDRGVGEITDRNATTKRVQLDNPTSEETDRSRRTTWHQMPQLQQPRRMAAKGNNNGRLSPTVGHYRIHPEWGWDAAPPPE